MKTDDSMKRRQFLALGAVAGVAAAAVPTFVPRTVFAQGKRPAANDRVVVGCVSAGHRSRLLMDQLPEGGQLVALADCNLGQAFAFREERGAKWDIYGEHYPLLERNDIDAVIIGAQEYQRVLPAIHAVQAGKDVYAEKPLTLYIEEGRTLVSHVRKHKTVFQVGTQQRSMEMNRVACEFVRSGGLPVIYKGAGAPQEFVEARKAIDWLGGETVRLAPVRVPGLGEQRFILLIKKTKATPDRYPRGQGLPRKKPLS